MEFMGFARPDGSVGIRNKILVISCEPVTDRVCLQVAESVSNTEPVLSLGWQERDNYNYLLSLIRNPNVAGAVILEKESGSLEETIVKEMTLTGKPVRFVSLEKCGGTIEATAKATRDAMLLAREASTYRRQLNRFSRLILGLIYYNAPKTEELLLCAIDKMVKDNGRIVLSKKTGNKKDKVGKYPVYKKLEPKSGVEKTPGLYELPFAGDHRSVLNEMAANSVQLVLSAAEKNFPSSHPILPVINITADEGQFAMFKDNIELDVSSFDYEKYSYDDYGLRIINEIIATASGKLTKGEILKL